MIRSITTFTLILLATPAFAQCYLTTGNACSSSVNDFLKLMKAEMADEIAMSKARCPEGYAYLVTPLTRQAFCAMNLQEPR